jgi:predicted small integral membrane protein
MSTRHFFKYLPILALASPSAVFASSTTDFITQFAGLFYIIVGLTLVASILLMVGGISMWFVRLGTADTYRDEAIEIMEWGIATLFTLILVLGVVEFIQRHTQTVLYIIGIAVILLVIWLVITSGALKGGGEKKEEK